MHARLVVVVAVASAMWGCSSSRTAGSSSSGQPTSGQAASAAAAETPPTYGPVTTIPVQGEGFWDYLSEDTVSHRLFVSHGTNAAVIDMTTNQVVGTIDSLPGVHGVAVAHELGKAFASAGRSNEVAVVDLKTLGVTKRIPAGQNPDGIMYDPDAKEVYAFNGRSSSATVIDAVGEKVVATIPLPGKPEFAVYDPGTKRVYDNIEDKAVMAVIDVSTHKLVESWPMAPCESPSGLAIDAAHHRLFAVCENGMMVMMDDGSGQVVGQVPIGEGPDAARFDPGTQLAFSSNGGSGTVTIAHLDSPSRLTVVQTLQTVRSARTMTLDPTTHRIYLSSARFEPLAPADTAGGRRRRPTMVPGSFKILVYGPQS